MRAWLLGLVASLMLATSAGAVEGVRAYIVNEVTVYDAPLFQSFLDQVPATLTPFGGSFIVRGGAVKVINGMPPSGRVVIISFPTRFQAEGWLSSPGYAEILRIREQSSRSRIYMVEGMGY